jgi:uncharacterized protein with NRDE domain
MCTLIALHRCFADAPLVVAANRDERLDRPARGPGLWPGARLPLAAPQDLEAGGTWLGVNGAGLLAAVTNRSGADRDESRRSRGLLVLDALEAHSAEEAADSMTRLPRDAYNPFNLMLADGRDAFVVSYQGKPRVAVLDRGPHVIGNADPDARSIPKLARLLESSRAAIRGSSQDALEALAGLCREHGAGASPLEDTCIHAGGYGTRSSTLLRLGTLEPAWWFADGPPCRTAYEDFSPLLYALGRGDRDGTGLSTARVVT